jgi:hypothetical protein
MARFAHLDEAGTSSKEPFAVVAGVISNPDKQWRALEQYLVDLADDLVPSEMREGAVFHAKDLWHGTGHFPKEKIDRDRRNRILQELAKIPIKFDVPVVVGATDKKQYADTPNKRELCYSVAFGMAAIAVEHFMRQYCDESEVASIIAEDVPEMRRHAKWGYKRLKVPKLWDNPLLPIQRIAETPNFAEKSDSSILQVADTLAFVCCRRLRGKEDVGFLFDEFKENIISWPSWGDVQPH